MCGLFGMVFGKCPDNDRTRYKAFKLFNELAIESAKRGRDATGMSIIYQDGASCTYKDVHPAPDIVNTSGWTSCLYEAFKCDVRVLMGHTRLGTHGNNVVGNAHPFVMDHPVHGELVGTHNGIIWNHDRILGTDVAHPYENDSANMFWAMSQHKHEDLPKLLEEVMGSFAIVMFRKPYVFMTRNKENPLYLVNVPEIKAMAYASDKDFLKAAAKRAGLAIGFPALLKEHKLYGIDIRTMDEIMADYTPKPIPKVPVTQELEVMLEAIEHEFAKEEEEEKRLHKASIKPQRKWDDDMVSKKSKPSKKSRKQKKRERKMLRRMRAAAVHG